jgi:LPPG:FO 2-phospho-L-lactate transferase
MSTGAAVTGTRVVVIAGGTGGARFLRGVREHLASAGGDPAEQVTAVVNTGDDITLFGLRICPDLDTVMYTLGGGIHEGQGWGRDDETFHVKEELASYGMKPDWFGLGDRDTATHLVRTQMLDAGYPLSEVTAALCARWSPGVRVLPMSDARIETHVVIDRAELGEEGAGEQAVHFQEWWLRLRAKVPARRFVSVGADGAVPAPGVVEALAAADVVLIAPSNPVVSVGTVLAVPGLRDAIVASPARVVGVSPIVGGAPVRGMADACLQTIGVESSAVGVAGLYGARSHGGLLDGWVVDSVDADSVDAVAALGVPARAVPAMMRDVTTATDLARDVLDFALTATR